MRTIEQQFICNESMLDNGCFTYFFGGNDSFEIKQVVISDGQVSLIYERNHEIVGGLPWNVYIDIYPMFGAAQHSNLLYSLPTLTLVSITSNMGKQELFQKSYFVGVFES